MEVRRCQTVIARTIRGERLTGTASFKLQYTQALCQTPPALPASDSNRSRRFAPPPPPMAQVNS